MRHFPAIIRFPGYVPFGHDGTPGGRLAFLRKCVGLTQAEVAQMAGIDTSRLWRYERNSPHRDKWLRGLWEQLVGLARRTKIWRHVEPVLQSNRGEG